MKIYLASSWRNEGQPDMVKFLRDLGHDVYDFRNPPDQAGFRWEEIHSDWQDWTPQRFHEALLHDRAIEGFQADYRAMIASDVCVLLLPCGRSAHLEAGWFCGMGRPVAFVMLSPNEPELMYKLGDVITSMDELADWLEELIEQATLTG